MSKVVLTPYAAADGSELVAQVAVPSSGGPVPAIVLFHGGSWRSTRRAASFDAHCRFFAARGLVAVGGTYRGIDSGATSIDDCVADARATMRWVRGMADVDPARIVVGGHSAGGHLALCLALGRDEADPAPDALIGLSPVINVRFPAHLSPNELIRPGAPPTLILQGARDSMTAPGPARRFTERMVQAGNVCRLELADGAHTFYAFRSQTYASFRHALRSMDAFLVQHLHLAPSPDLERDIDALGVPQPTRSRRTTTARDRSAEVAAEEGR
jgi:acetyl esterase/lipase